MTTQTDAALLSILAWYKTQSRKDLLMKIIEMAADISNERERCAKIADGVANDEEFCGNYATALKIAAAIRSNQ